MVQKRRKQTPSAVIQWITENQPIRGEDLVFPVTSLAGRCVCWRWRGAEYFYSVAGELLPPGGEQKYTHRYLQYIQTQILRQSDVWLGLTSVNSGFWWSKNIWVTVCTLEVDFMLPVDILFTSCFHLFTSCFLLWAWVNFSLDFSALWTEAHLPQVRGAWSRSKNCVFKTGPGWTLIWTETTKCEALIGCLLLKCTFVVNVHLKAFISTDFLYLYPFLCSVINHILVSSLSGFQFSH